MGSSNKILEPTMVLALAVLFLVYHVAATIFGMVSFARVLFGQEAEAQVESTRTVSADTSVTEVQQSNQIIYGVDVSQAGWPNRIVITPAGLNTSIHGLEDSTSEPTTSNKLVAFDPNSALPNGQAGNTKLFGNDSGGPFQGLHQLKVGDEILIKMPSTSYTYTVVGFKVIPQAELSSISQTNYSSLTLVALSNETGDEHFAVVANYSRTNME